MRITSCLIALTLLTGFGLTANADNWHGHRGYSHGYRGYSGWHGGYRSGYYYHGYPRRYYGGTSFYFGAPYYAPYYAPTYPYGYVETRPVYRGREVVYSQGSLGVDVQRALRKKGYYSGPIDGEIGPMTRSAIRSYQRDHDLRETGTITTALLERLGL